MPILAFPRRVATSSRTKAASGLGRVTGELPKAIRDGVPGDVDVVDGELADRGNLLRVEDQQQSSNAIRGGQRVVAEEASCVGPAFLAVDGALRAGPADGAASETVGMAMLYGPADEVAGLVAVAKSGIGHPVFQVGLRAGAQAESRASEPGEEVVGRGDVAADVEVLELGGVLVTDAAAEATQVVPDRVTVQNPAFGGVRASLDCRDDPFLQGDEPFVARRQGARRHEDTAQVSQNLARREFVENAVGDGCRRTPVTAPPSTEISAPE